MRKFIVALLLILGMFLAGCGDLKPAPDRAGVTVTTEDGQPVKKPVVKKTKVTKSQQQAIKAAKEYLAFKSFSKQGLIHQLSADAGSGFSVADSKYAVNHLPVNWNEQAARSAKEYLDMMAFSRSGLIRQLTSPAGDRYTKAQAEYGVKKAGL